MQRSAMVTGASGGIGLATCLELAAAGYSVVGTVRSDEAAAAVADAAGERGVADRVSTVRCDVTDAVACAQAVEETTAALGEAPWALVNNAGFAQPGAVEEVDDEAARHQLEVNLLAPARFSRLVLPGMQARGDGRIVMVSSIAGRVSFPFMGWYDASKQGLEGLTDALRIEVARDGVRVVLVEPGSFGTGIWAEGQSRLPAPAGGSRYAEQYARGDAISQAPMPSPVWVARTIRLALANPVPLPRYVVGVDAVAAIAAHSLLPTAVTDYVKAVGSGLRPAPLGAPLAAPLAALRRLLP